MKKNYYQLLHKIRNAFRRGKRNERPERGQVLVIVALSVIGLVAAVGLTVDVGLLYLNHGKLRRAVDAATLAASSQFREGYSTTELEKAAEEFLVLNGVNDPSATVETCVTAPGDPVLCTDPPRKLVRVQATSTMQLAFLPVVGIRTTTVRATAVSEAASMDVVFVIDASDSMTYDAPEDVNDPEHYLRDPSQCNPINNCHPFKEVKEAAKAFVDQLYFPYDRVAIVTFDDRARPVVFDGDYGTNGDGDYEAFWSDGGEIKNAIDALEVISPDICDTTIGPCREYERYADDDPVYGNGDTYPNEPFIDADNNGVFDTYLSFACPIFNSWDSDVRTGNPDTCGTTSIGRGMLMAGNEFANPLTFRQESLWVVILLTDGAANGPSYACPESAWPNPKCRDNNAATRHCDTADSVLCLTNGGTFDPDVERYDADDYARDMADFVSESQDALIFTIGLGELVRTSIPRALFDVDTGEPILVSGHPVECDTLAADCWGAGEQYLRYAAEVGRGKYYFAPSGNQLRDIFLDIAQNLATRLTQ